MKKKFVLTILALICALCATCQVGSQSVDSKDANMIVYTKTFFNSHNIADSIMYISLSGDVIRVNKNMNVQARPDISEHIDEYVEKHLSYPSSFHGQGKVILLLYIDKNGHRAETRVLGSIPGCDLCLANTIDLIDKIERWIPALDDAGEPINSILPLSVRFK